MRYTTESENMGRIVQCAFLLQLAGLCLASQPIGIVLAFDSEPEVAIIGAMTSEIRNILLPAEIPVTFQRLGEVSALRSFQKIVMVRFRGSCQEQLDSREIQLIAPALLEFPPLGKTDVSGGHVLPFVQIFCNEVRAFVPAVSSLPFIRMYGRALGRVVAHELYHVLLGTRSHRQTGVVRVAQTGRDLTRDGLTLDARSILELHELYGAHEKEGGSAEPPSKIMRLISDETGALEYQPER